MIPSQVHNTYGREPHSILRDGDPQNEIVKVLVCDILEICR